MDVRASDHTYACMDFFMLLISMLCLSLFFGLSLQK